ncbi:MAG: nucleotide pyrophosphohydrolase [Pirellulaceae bacterium]|nr:nucleotide pyrophosphohydrolase [Pirellulaceae bacterium]
MTLPSTISDSSDSLSVFGLQKQIDDWCTSVGVRYFNELTNLAQLMEEVGELSRIISRTYGEQSWKVGDSAYNLGDEMADVLFVLVCLANQTGVDLTKAIEQNIAKKTQRDATRHQNNHKLKPDHPS